MAFQGGGEYMEFWVSTVENYVDSLASTKIRLKFDS